MRHEAAIVGDGTIITPITDRDRMDLMCARQCLAVLEAKYPGYLWFVECSGNTGLIQIRNLSLDGKLGYNVHLKGQFSASDMEKVIMQAGGEVLERFNQPRGRAEEASLMEAPRDFAGRMVCDAE